MFCYFKKSFRNLAFETQTSFFAIDIRSHFYFWVDKKQKQIYKATSTGTVGRPIATDTYGKFQDLLYIY